MVNCFEKIIEFILIGPFDKVQQEENDGMKRQDTITSEVFGGFFIRGKKFFRKDDSLKKIN